MDSLYKLNLNINKEYIELIENLLKVFFTYIFLILVEGNIKPDVLTILVYSLLGHVFYQLVFKKLILLE